MGPFMEAVCRIIRALGIYFAKTFGCCGRHERLKCRRPRSSRGSEEKTDSHSDDKKNGSHRTEKKEKKKKYRKKCHKSDRSRSGSTTEQPSDDNRPGTPGTRTAGENPQQSPSTSHQDKGPDIQEAPSSRPQSGDDVSQDYISLRTSGGFVGGAAQNSLLCERCVERISGSNMDTGPIIINAAAFNRVLPGAFDEYLEELSQQSPATSDVNTVPSYIS